MPDPRWLIAVNSVSLAMALIANMALVLNMARRLSFAIAQPITIIGWYISGFLLIALVAVADSESAGFRLEPRNEHALSQAFYYAILASILYMVVASLMVVTVVGAHKGHYKKEFSLTTAQRTLMLQTIMFMGYLLLGALVFAHVEHWQYLDAVFFASFTLLTIGLGSPYTPQTHLGRSLLFPYAIGGILTVGLVIGSIRSLALERGKHKLKARFMEKKRQNTIESINPNKRVIKVSWFKRYKFDEEGLNEAERREQEFNIMRKIQQSAHSSEKYMALAMSFGTTMVLWLVGAAVFATCERPQGWTYFTALYFSYTTLLTIGYGDVQPESNSGKPFFVLWTLLAVPTLTILISHLGDTVIKTFADFSIWAGSITILPDEQGFRKNIKTVFKNYTPSRINPKELRMDKPPGFLPASTTEDQQNELDQELQEHALDRIAEYVEEEELDQAREAEEKGDTQGRDMKLFHYVLVKELKKVVSDLHTDPDKRYSYRDWAWYLKLLRQDESDDKLHQEAPRTTEVTEDERKHVGMADAKDKKKWSWMDVRSPLMSTQGEPEWLVERLGAALENEMRAIRRGEKGELAPISMGDLTKRRKNDKRKESDQSEDVKVQDSEMDAEIS